MKSLKMIFIVVMVMFLSGCGLTKKPFHPYWEKGITVYESNCRILDLFVVPSGPHSLKISGRIVDGSILLATIEKYWVKKGAYNNSRWVRRTIKWIPTTLRIGGDSEIFSSPLYLKIDSLGRFNGEISLYSRFFTYDFNEDEDYPYNDSYKTRKREVTLIPQVSLSGNARMQKICIKKIELPDIWL